MYNINLLEQALGDDVRFSYAMSCSFSMPTRAVIHPQGSLASEEKSAFQKLVKSDLVVKSCASSFNVQNRSQEDISELRKELMVDLAASLRIPYTIITASYRFHQESG